MPEVHHATVYFTGRVQGVGFRYQALQVAREFEVSGVVQNLPDGRVQLEAEGAAEEVRAFIHRSARREVSQSLHLLARDPDAWDEARCNP